MSSPSPRKRKNPDDVEEETNQEPSAKISRLSVSEFRLKLKGSDPIDALKQFLKDEKEEQIDDYIREGGSLSELLAILNNFDDVKKSVPQAIPVFQAITIFIIKCIRNYPDKRKELIEECRQLLSIHLSLFHNMLTAVYSPRQKKVALKLLTALISCDEGLAWTILSFLKLTRQDIEALAFARKQSDPTSVREHFIRFLMSFLIDQPLSLIQKFISQKGLLSSIFGGLKSDSYQDVLMVLTTLKSKIVDVKGINKSLKRQVFNTASLCHLIGVYSWDPRNNASHPSQTVITLEGRDEVRKCLHELLLVLLTSFKMGVVFKDPSIGTTSKEFNELVSTVISGFGKPWGDEMREDLFLKMLSACPDVIKQAYRQMNPFFSDFNSARWIQGIMFFTKLIDQLDLQVSTVPFKNRTNLIKSVFLPSLIVPKLMKSILSDEISCRISSLTCLNVCLKRLNSYEQHYSASAINNYLITNLSCAENLVKSVEYFSSGEVDDSNSIKGLLAALDSLLISYRTCPQLLDTIRNKETLYDTLRECLKQTKIKISLTNQCGNTNDNQMEVESESDCQLDAQLKLVSLKLIKLLLIVWPRDSSQDDYEYWLEDLSECISPVPEVVQESLSIVQQILGSTGYFMGQCQKELEIWMYCLSNHLTFDSIKLIVKSIKYSGINTKLIYSDLLSAEKLMTMEEEASSLALNLDDFINASQEEKGSQRVGTSGNVFSLSIPLLSMLKIQHEEQSFKDSDHFVVSLIVHLFHRQVSCDIFVALLKLYSEGRAVSSVLNYADNWAKLSGSVLFVQSSFTEQSIFSQTSMYLLGKSEMPNINDIKEEEFKLLMSQILFYTVHGSPPALAAALSRCLLLKFNSSCTSTLSFQPLVDSFHPREDLESPLNSSQLVMVLVEMSSDSPAYIVPYQDRLAFELRYALQSRSALDSRSSIGKILNVIKLSDDDITDLFKNCCPLPKKQAYRTSTWRPIQEYLLREALRLKLKLKSVKLLEFLNEISSSLHNFSSDEDKMFLDTLDDYLEQTYKNKSFTEPIIEIFSDLLKALLCHEVWSESLARFLYKHVPVEVSHIPLNRLAVVLESGFHHLTTNQISKLIYSRISELVEAITSQESTPWIDKLTSTFLSLKFGETDSNLKNICKVVLEKKNEIHVSECNVKFLHSLLSKARKETCLFSLAEDYILRPTSLKDQSLGTCLADIMHKLLISDDCCLNDELVKVLLSTGLKEPFPKLLQLLSHGVKIQRTLFSAKEMFALLTSHSLFLNIMISKNTDIKYEVLVLLEALLKKDSSLMKSSHIPVYFGAYNASLSLQDQIILQILKMYEDSGINLTEFKPYVWGKTALQKYSLNQQRKTLDDDSGMPTIQLLDLDVIHTTIKYFPVNRTLSGNEVKEIEKGSEIYDVVFLLGALSQVIGPDSSIYPSEIPCYGISSLAFISLGSQCYDVRAAGYHILHRHYTSLSQRKDDQIWSNLVEKLRRSVCGTENARLSGPLSVFLARASLIMSEPLHPLYQSMHNYILAQPIFRLDTVPAFLEFFHSSNAESGRQLQSWILDVVKDGIRGQDDLQIILSSFTSKLLMDFYTCSLASRKTQTVIEEILDKCIACDSKRHLLTTEYSLIPWLMNLKKYDQALVMLPSAQRYAPLKKLFEHCIKSSSIVNNPEEKLIEDT